MKPSSAPAPKIERRGRFEVSYDQLLSLSEWEPMAKAPVGYADSVNYIWEHPPGTVETVSTNPATSNPSTGIRSRSHSRGSALTVSSSSVNPGEEGTPMSLEQAQSLMEQVNTVLSTLSTMQSNLSNTIYGSSHSQQLSQSQPPPQMLIRQSSNPDVNRTVRPTSSIQTSVSSANPSQHSSGDASTK